MGMFTHFVTTSNSVDYSHSQTDQMSLNQLISYEKVENRHVGRQPRPFLGPFGALFSDDPCYGQLVQVEQRDTQLDHGHGAVVEYIEQ